VLTNGKGFYDPLVYVLESYRLGLRFLPPTVNEPGPGFEVVENPKSEIRNPKETRNPKPERALAPVTMADPTTRSESLFENACRGRARLLPSLSGSGKTVVVAGSAGASPYRRTTFQTRSESLDAGGSSFAIRVPLTRAKGLTERTIQRLLAERERGAFASLADFHGRVRPAPEEMEVLIRAGGFDEFGEPRTRQFWAAQRLVKCGMRKAECGTASLEFDFDAGRNPVAEFFAQQPDLLREPTRRERLEAETELFGYAVSGHPLELFPDVAWATYCPVARLGEHIGETVVTCGLVVEQRTHHQITGEPMKFLTLADWTGMVETELFAQTYRSYGLATVRYPVLEVTATPERYENGRGFSLRVHRAGPPRQQPAA